jgi:hypothetical protein
MCYTVNGIPNRTSVVGRYRGDAPERPVPNGPYVHLTLGHQFQNFRSKTLAC